MHKKRICILATVFIASWATAGAAAQPKVVKTVPDNGDIDVDPNLTEIRIAFDQAMAQGGMSIVGGGETFPEMRGKPKWTSPRTIAMRVKLEPNHAYWLSINNDQFQNFTNKAGEPAVPYPIQFRTGGDEGASAPADDDAPILAAKENRRAFNLLRSAVRDRYSYRDRTEVDWDALLKGHEDSLVAAATPLEFAQLAGHILAKAQDKHIWLQVEDQRIASYVRPSTPNANYKLLPTLVPHLKKHGRAVVSGHWDDGLGYLAVASWDPGKLENGQAVTKAMNELRGMQALVIDVRLNGGGDESLAQQLAGRFVDERKLYAKHVFRDPKSSSGFTPVFERWIEPEPPRYAGRIAVLSGPAVMSSCEAFLLMMKRVPEAVIVGAPSQGSSGNPRPHDLGNGVTVFLPSWKSLTPEGEELEGVGVPPDIAVDASPDDFGSADPVLAAALAHLRKTSGE